ncbi:class I SAM-dependent methyltransferase [Myxococcus landrumensis]|uniref:Class I SAM-dependent methyltransferase n=1 Tax=Myxococcus landrumensis TaxID=2813577 RepID=A0ABX7N430_9BACT|nr:class I SAM-dependent methyltransferase [Myxococcus landrumus]QSQ13517.1 class I SAM-dependent methyltransferase [Myxococcus landrumus]
MDIAEEQRAFYGALLDQYGDDPRSLSHRDQATQYERFHRLARVFEGESGPFSVHEIGCGLGHFGEYLQQHHAQARYSGSDVHPSFTEACARKFPQGTFHTRDIVAALPPERYDYLTLSGTFNVRLSASPEEWRGFVEGMLGAMYALCTKGFSVNFLTTFHDPEYTREDLYYQPPGALLDFVVGKLSRFWELDAAGPLYEYTLRVYHPEYVRTRHADDAFTRYFRSAPRPPST